MSETSSVFDAFRLDGRVALITGASRGLGAATALMLAQAGADVVVAARSADTLNEVGKAVDSLGRRAVCIACDLSDLSNMSKLVDAAGSTFGGVDVVINNVGGSMPQPFLETTLQDFEAAFHFNVSTAFKLTQLAVPLMLARGGGSVVNVSSAMGTLSDRGYAAYGTAKAALTQLTRLLAADLAPRIRVNAVAPGAIATDSLQIVLNDEIEQLMISGTPLRRLGSPDDIARGILYLASDASSYVSGHVLAIDGGLRTPNLSMGIPDLEPS